MYIPNFGFQYYGHASSTPPELAADIRPKVTTTSRRGIPHDNMTCTMTGSPLHSAFYSLCLVSVFVARRCWCLSTAPHNLGDPSSSSSCPDEISTKSTFSRTEPSVIDQLDVPALQQTIAEGRAYQHRNFLNEQQVQALLDEMDELEQQGSFRSSGLSNTARQHQNFGTTDRSTCVVPWWRDLLLGDTDAMDRTENASTRDLVGTKLKDLQQTLADVLHRPTLAENSENMAHECYFSQSKVGSLLPRHMDERHEELKGARGWLLPSRRSISWLVYLSDDGWDLGTNGGALKTFPQRQVLPRVAGNPPKLSAHHGNLQVGWLSPLYESAPSLPVYMDSWFPLTNAENVVEPHCILYMLADDDGNVDNAVQYISKPWLTEALGGMSMSDFWKNNASTIFDADDNGKSAARRFVPLEDRDAWDTGEVPRNSVAVDILPERGSLVIFDSVTLPHQVEIIHSGTRRALAGWFHEQTQPFPSGLS